MTDADSHPETDEAVPVPLLFKITVVAATAYLVVRLGQMVWWGVDRVF